jgi:hypothetical protein
MYVRLNEYKKKATGSKILGRKGNRGESISSNPYVMFKFSVRSELTRKYYERRICGDDEPKPPT